MLQLNFQGDRVRDYGSQSGFKPSLFPSLSPKWRKSLLPLCPKTQERGTPREMAVPRMLVGALGLSANGVPSQSSLILNTAQRFKATKKETLRHHKQTSEIVGSC